MLFITRRLFICHDTVKYAASNYLFYNCEFPCASLVFFCQLILIPASRIGVLSDNQLTVYVTPFFIARKKSLKSQQGIIVFVLPFDILVSFVEVGDLHVFCIP